MVDVTELDEGTRPGEQAGVVGGEVAPPERHGRLAWLEPGSLGGAERELYDQITSGARAAARRSSPLTDHRGRLEGPFNAMLFSPEVGAALAELGSAIRFRGRLAPRLRELAILELASCRKSAFEWRAHEPIAREQGLSEAALEAVRRGEEASDLGPEEVLVRRIVRALVVERDLDDELAEAAEAVLGTAGASELVILVGYYDLLALSLQVWRTPLPEGSPLTGLEKDQAR